MVGRTISHYRILSELGRGGMGVAVIRVEHGRFGFLDVHNKRFSGTKRLVCELTLRDGAVVWDLNGLAGEDTDQTMEKGGLVQP